MKLWCEDVHLEGVPRSKAEATAHEERTRIERKGGQVLVQRINRQHRRKDWRITTEYWRP